jgi:hypothetical protein
MGPLRYGVLRVASDANLSMSGYLQELSEAIEPAAGILPKIKAKDAAAPLLERPEISQGLGLN